jgi:cytoskeletal protein RodZ
MNRNTTIAIWIIVIIIIVIAGIWWYNAAQSPSISTETPTQTQSSDKAITSFTFQTLTPAANATIDEGAHTITVNVPPNTNVTSLTPTIEVSDSATVSPASGTPQNFTNPVTYTVTAQDGSTQNYIVTVNKTTSGSSSSGSSSSGL